MIKHEIDSLIISKISMLLNTLLFALLLSLPLSPSVPPPHSKYTQLTVHPSPTVSSPLMVYE